MFANFIVLRNTIFLSFILWTSTPAGAGGVFPEYIVKECYGSFFNFDCGEGNKIRINHDTFGTSRLASVNRNGSIVSCRSERWDCTVPNPKRSSLLRRYCNGRRSCRNYLAERRACSGEYTNYQQIEYNCIPEDRVTDICTASQYEINGPTYIASPSFPHNYPPKQSCACLITAPSAGVNVKLEVVHMAIRYARPCADWLQIGSRRLCGTAMDFYVGTSIPVVFHSDATHGHRGFWLQATPSKPRYKLLVRCGTVTSHLQRTRPRHESPQYHIPKRKAYRTMTRNQHNLNSASSGITIRNSPMDHAEPVHVWNSKERKPHERPRNRFAKRVPGPWFHQIYQYVADKWALQQSYVGDEDEVSHKRGTWSSVLNSEKSSNVERTGHRVRVKNGLEPPRMTLDFQNWRLPDPKESHTSDSFENMHVETYTPIKENILQNLFVQHFGDGAEIQKVVGNRHSSSVRSTAGDQTMANDRVNTNANIPERSVSDNVYADIGMQETIHEDRNADDYLSRDQNAQFKERGNHIRRPVIVVHEPMQPYVGVTLTTVSINVARLDPIKQQQTPVKLQLQQTGSRPNCAGSESLQTVTRPSRLTLENQRNPLSEVKSPSSSTVHSTLGNAVSSTLDSRNPQRRMDRRGQMTPPRDESVQQHPSPLLLEYQITPPSNRQRSPLIGPLSTAGSTMPPGTTWIVTKGYDFDDISPNTYSPNTNTATASGVLNTNLGTAVHWRSVLTTPSRSNTHLQVRDEHHSMESDVSVPPTEKSWDATIDSLKTMTPTSVRDIPVAEIVDTVTFISRTEILTASKTGFYSWNHTTETRHLAIAIGLEYTSPSLEDKSHISTSTLDLGQMGPSGSDQAIFDDVTLSTIDTTTLPMSAETNASGDGVIEPVSTKKRPTELVTTTPDVERSDEKATSYYDGVTVRNPRDGVDNDGKAQKQSLLNRNGTSINITTVSSFMKTFDRTSNILSEVRDNDWMTDKEHSEDDGSVGTNRTKYRMDDGEVLNKSLSANENTSSKGDQRSGGSDDFNSTDWTLTNNDTNNMSSDHSLDHHATVNIVDESDGNHHSQEKGNWDKNRLTEMKTNSGENTLIDGKEDTTTTTESIVGDSTAHSAGNRTTADSIERAFDPNIHLLVNVTEMSGMLPNAPTKQPPRGRNISRLGLIIALGTVCLAILIALVILAIVVHRRCKSVQNAYRQRTLRRSRSTQRQNQLWADVSTLERHLSKNDKNSGPTHGVNALGESETVTVHPVEALYVPMLDEGLGPNTMLARVIKQHTPRRPRNCVAGFEDSELIADIMAGSRCGSITLSQRTALAGASSADVSERTLPALAVPPITDGAGCLGRANLVGPSPSPGVTITPLHGLAEMTVVFDNIQQEYSMGLDPDDSDWDTRSSVSV